MAVNCTPYGRIARHRTATPTGSAGSYCAARSQRARSCITVAAYTPAGTLTIWSLSPTPRTNGTCARRDAAKATRCQEPISESAQTGHEPVELATQRTSGRSGSASASAGIPDSPSDEYQISHRRLR